MIGPVRDRRRAEDGFSLVELLVVLIIVSILVACVWIAIRSAKASARIDAMKSAAAAVDTAVGAYNRMYPAVGGIPDPLMNLQQGMTGNPASPGPTSLADETGEFILAQWPQNPYADIGTGVTFNRYNTAAPCTQVGTPGEVRVCRTGNGGQSYRIAAYARNHNGATITVYTATHGPAT